MALVALLVILVIEAAAQRRLMALALSLIILVAAAVLFVAVWSGFVFWRIVLAAVLAVAGLVLLVINIQEVRRT